MFRVRTFRVSILTLLGLLLLPPALGLARVPGDAARTHRQILRGLGLEPGRLTKKEIRSYTPKLMAPCGRSLKQAIRQLRTQPFLTRPVVHDATTLAFLSKSAVEGRYSPFASPEVRPSAPAYQRRVHGVYWQLAGRLRRELGISKDGIGPLLVLEGGPAKDVGAAALPNGSIVFHRASVDVADRVATAIVSARGKRDLLGNLLSIALGRTPPATDTRKARHIADGFVAATVGHEMTHGLKKGTAVGRPADVEQTPFGIRSRAFRTQELVADAGGAELAMRGGFSPAGILGFYAYLAVAEAYTGGMNGPLAGTHPRSIDRYQLVHRHLTRRADQRRLIYDGVHPPRHGTAYLDPSERAALQAFPTPAELREYVMTLPHGVGYLYPKAPAAVRKISKAR
jgi:hypothetical protein